MIDIGKRNSRFGLFAGTIKRFACVDDIVRVAKEYAAGERVPYDRRHSHYELCEHSHCANSELSEHSHYGMSKLCGSAPETVVYYEYDKMLM